MSACLQTIQDYALRSIGIGERLLPRSDFTLCEQVVLIGSGMIWNIYFGIFALIIGFFLATGLAVAKGAQSPWLRKPAEWFSPEAYRIDNPDLPAAVGSVLYET